MIFKGMFWSYSCVFILGCMVHLYASSMGNQQGSRALYCVELKDGVPVLTSEGKPVLNEITFTNGTKLKTDGTVTRKDGTQYKLKEGECVNDSVEVSKPARITKAKK
jgi:hypothetical protein